MNAGFMIILSWEKQTLLQKKVLLVHPLDSAGGNIHTALQGHDLAKFQPLLLS